MTFINAIASLFGLVVCSGCRRFTRIDRQTCCYRGSSCEELSLNFCRRCYPLFQAMLASQFSAGFPGRERFR